MNLDAIYTIEQLTLGNPSTALTDSRNGRLKVLVSTPLGNRAFLAISEEIITKGAKVEVYSVKREEAATYLLVKVN